MEGILHALPDPLRAAIFGDMAGAGCAQTCSTFQQVIDRSIPKSTLSQHFPALREVWLIRSERQGVEMLDTTRCDEINRRFPSLLPSIKASLPGPDRRLGRRQAQGDDEAPGASVGRFNPPKDDRGAPAAC